MEYAEISDADEMGRLDGDGLTRGADLGLDVVLSCSAVLFWRAF